MLRYLCASTYRSTCILFAAALLLLSPGGSALAQVELVEFPAVGPYNGFNAQQNIVECVNFGTQGTNVRLTLKRANGVVAGSQVQAVPAFGSAHYILNSIANIANDIGTYELEKLDANFDAKIACGTVFYRFAPNGRPNYAFMVPVKAQLVGDSYGMYNSFDPSGIEPTKNWLTIINPNSAEDIPQGSANFVADVRVYRQDGSLKKKIPINLGPGQRVDIELGTPEGMFTGLYKVDAKDSTPYESFLARYNSPNGGQSYSFAFSQLTHQGSCDESLPISTMGNGGGTTINWLEIGNPTGYSVPVTVTVRDQTGAIQHVEQRNIAPLSQDNIQMNQFIDPSSVGNMGTVTVQCNDPERKKLLLQSAFYGRTGPGGAISWAYVSQARGLPMAESDDVLVGSVNTFVGAENWVGVINRLSNVPVLKTNQFNQVGGLVNSVNFPLAALGTHSYDAHSVVGPNMVGTVAVGSGNSLPRIVGELNRVYRDQAGSIVEIMPTPLALVKGGLPCVGGGCANMQFAGRSDSLMPYRENLTPLEVSHFLRKVALGGDQHLYNVGVQHGLSAMVSAMFNYQEPFNVEAKAMEVAEPEFSEGRWDIDGGRNWWITHLRYGNPIRGKMSLILHDHLATPLGDYSNNSYYHHFIEKHLRLLHDNALGSFRTFVKELLFDNANGRQLNLVDNHCGQPNSNDLPGCNENFPREYFELLLMGQFDPFTGETNYTEYDVQHGFSYALSGFVDWSTTDPNYAGMAWDEGLWYPTTYGQFTVFAGTPFHTVAAFDYDSFTDYVMQVHTQPARYLAYTLFSRLTGVAPTSQIVTNLAAHLRATDYDLRSTVEMIVKSQALFSSESRKSCVGSPVENLMFFMRTLDLPLERSPQNVYSDVRNFLVDTGHELLTPQTVFGFGECFGHTGAPDGSNFLSAQRFLEGPYRNFRQILNRIRSLISSGGTTFTFSQLLPFPGASALQTAQSLVNRLGIEMSTPEVHALAEYLATRKRYDTGQTFPLNWDPEDNTLYTNIVESKVPGAIEILFSHPGGYLR